MILKNYYKILRCALTGTTCDIVRTDGTEQSFTPASTKFYAYTFGIGQNSSDSPSDITNYKNLASTGVKFGDGNSHATMDDYCLSGNLLTNLDITANTTRTVEDGGVTVQHVYTITNKNTEDITIREVGMVAGIPYGTSISKHMALIERTVLDSPVTIPAGGVGQVTYTIRFNYPTT